jgi:hypothetical protein
MHKTLTMLLLLPLIAVSLKILPGIAQAQFYCPGSCYSQLRIDPYLCGSNGAGGCVAWPIDSNNTHMEDCTANGLDCHTLSGICASDDAQAGFCKLDLHNNCVWTSGCGVKACCGDPVYTPSPTGGGGGGGTTPSRTPTATLVPGVPTPTLTPTLVPGVPTPTGTPTPTLTLTPSLTPTPTLTLTPGGPYAITVKVWEGDNCSAPYTIPSAGFEGTVDLNGPIYFLPRAVNDLTNTQTFTDSTYMTGSATWISTISVISPGWSRTCPADDYRSTGLVSSDTTLHFYVSKNSTAWWQTVGGDVGANSGHVTSILPDPVIFASMSDFGMDDGVLLYDNGYNLNWGSTPRKFSDRNLISGATGTPFDDLGDNKEGYDHFSRLLSSEIQTLTLPVDASIPSGVYFTGSALPIGGFILDGNKKVVLLVNNSVTITGNITVVDGSFFAVIAKNDITIQPGVLNVQGIYIADGDIDVGTGSLAFEGQGMFIGWNSVIMQRDLGALNATTPAEFFIYRPDLLINAPDEFRQSTYEWREVAP